MGALPVVKLTVQEYFALDAASERPLEYHDGEIFQMVDATPQHARISSNTTFSLAKRLEGTPCFGNTNLNIRTTGRNYVVPDITVVCGNVIPSPESRNSVVNPKLIVEILSPSTADFDHGGKFDLYCQLPTFEEYVLIAQDKPKVEVFTKESETRWILTKYDGIEATIRLESLNLDLPAAEIYTGVEFPPPQAQV